MQAKQLLCRWLWFAGCALVSGTVLFLFGSWCLESTNSPPPPLALPLPQRFLTGLGFMLLNPLSLIPLTLILVASRFLACKLSKPSAAAVMLLGLTLVLVGAFWVPEPSRALARQHSW